jgi:hypothetical protein
MGYRHYFYKVKKSNIDEVKAMTYEQLLEYAERNDVEMDEWNGKKSFYFNDEKFLNKVEVHEFGKLYWDDTAERIYSKGKPLFEIKETQDAFGDYVPYVVGKEGLLEAISIYQEKVVKYYKDFLVDGQDRQITFGFTLRKEDVKSIDELVEHIKDKIIHLTYRSFANIDVEDKWQVTSSWEYEHSIFNLVHILKTIDWTEDTILFYGW